MICLLLINCKQVLKFLFNFIATEKLSAAKGDKTKEKVPNEESHHVSSSVEVWTWFLTWGFIDFGSEIKQKKLNYVRKKSFSNNDTTNGNIFACCFPLMAKTNGIKLYLCEKGFLFASDVKGILLWYFLRFSFAVKTRWPTINIIWLLVRTLSAAKLSLFVSKRLAQQKAW